MTLTGKLTFDPIALVLGVVAIIEAIRGEFLVSLVFLVGSQASWVPVTWDDVDVRPWTVAVFSVFALLGYGLLALDAIMVIA